MPTCLRGTVRKENVRVPVAVEPSIRPGDSQDLPGDLETFEAEF